MPESNGYWFPAKRYGWGWGLPVAWQGWTILVAFVALLIAGVFEFLFADKVVAFLVYTVVITLVFLAICYAKGEPPGWRWGGK